MEISSLTALRSVLLDTFASATSSRHQSGASHHRERHHNIGRSRRTSRPRPDAYATGKHADDGIGKHYTDDSSFLKPFRGAHTETFLNRVSRNTNNMFVAKDNNILVSNESDSFTDSVLKNVRSQTVEIDPNYVSEDDLLASLTPEQIKEMENEPGYKCLMEGGGGLETTSSGGCNVSWDSLLCWPPTPPETRAVLPCFSELNGIRYDISQNASRWCHGNGTWERTNYSACHHLRSTEAESAVDPTFYIYFGGYSLSLLALVIAIWIFLYFKDLRCLRNTIHTNLMFTYLLTDFMWILTLILQMSVQTDMTSCVFLIILLHYFHLTSFFWMFVEGLYLYMLVVETFYGENMKLKVYAGIGWGGPSIFVISWAIAKIFTTDVNETQIVSADSNMWRHCPWMSPHQLDWLYQAPALIVLAINLLFLLIIMWVLITKLRSANTLETQQYRKATKALLVLIPLLGTTYVLVIVGPTEGISRNIYDSIRAILLSTQGFTVALFYCFLNTEVQNTMRHHIECWRERRSISGSRRYTYNYSQSKDWSPRSRTESIRLYSQPTNIYKKRESTASETTTTTLVGGVGRMSNGSQPGGRASCTSPFLVAGAGGGENAV